MNDQIEEIKSKIDIVSFISEYIELKKAGRNYKALCPFHSEKTPSFMVSPELQIFKCFGCGEGGDVISFLQKYEGMEFYEALKFLAERTGVKLKLVRGKLEGVKEKLYQINKDAQYLYSWVLLNHSVGKETLNYLLTRRGLTLETIKTFGLGFSPENPFFLKKYLVDKKKYSVKDLELVGLVIPKGNLFIDRFRGRVIFPLHDHRGNIVGFSGRILPKDENKDLAKYINTPETPIYHKSKVLYGLNMNYLDIKKQKECLIVEGELDCLSCWQVGIKNIVAVKGSSLTEEQIRILSRFAERLIFAFDRDWAGDQAARRGVEIVEKYGLEVRAIDIFPYKDPDEAAHKDPKGLLKSIKNSVLAWEFIINQIFRKYKSKEGLEKEKISKEVVPVISRIDDKIVQAHYASLVARSLSVPLEAVLAEVEKFEEKKEEGIISESQKDKALEKTRREILEERLLSIAFKLDSRILVKKKIFTLITTHLCLRIVVQLKEFLKKNKSFDPSIFASSLPKELSNSFIEMLLKQLPGIEEETSPRLEKELSLITRELEILNLKEKIKEVGEMIKKLEAKKDKTRLINKEKQFLSLVKKLSELEGKNFKGIIL